MVKLTSLMKNSAVQEKPKTPEKEKTGGSFGSLKKILAGGVTQSEQVMFAKRLAFLMRAGVPILEALQMLSEQMRSGGGKKIMQELVADVANGHFLATAMEKHKNAFGDFTVNIVRVGEEGGILAENLNYLAEELKKKQALRKKVIGALFYPFFIVAATLIMVIILTMVVFPKVLPIFTSINVPLPISTRMLMAASKFLLTYGWWLFLASGSLVFGFLLALKNKNFKTFLDRILLAAPLAGTIARSYYLANFARTMGLLLKGEARLNEALKTASATAENLIYKQEFANIQTVVNRGEKISEYMKKNPKYFPSMVTHMLAVGERAGNLSGSFMYLAEMYESDVEDITKNLSSLIEPVLMVIMGVLVGFVAVSIITPIYSITQKLHP
jgi:type II secretory pathway component PulF